MQYWTQIVKKFQNNYINIYIVIYMYVSSAAAAYHATAGG